MFEYALAVAGDTTEDLGEVLHISRRDFCERDTFRFRALVPSMEYASLLIENELLLRANRGGRVYAGFQRLSRMEPVVARYMRIADLSERLYVFGEPDWTPPRHPNMKVTELAPGFALAREWIVIADSPTMSVALVGLDEEGFDVEDLEARHFSAFKTSDPTYVKLLAAAADRLIG
ncbi:MAG TPA: DICT sensory domain-containing protein [Pyrinomonadaceae bacterium]|nr:DICT sensory domain-containing protein [Pyrinomonadaceae bacterium]